MYSYKINNDPSGTFLGKSQFLGFINFFSRLQLKRERESLLYFNIQKLRTRALNMSI